MQKAIHFALTFALAAGSVAVPFASSAGAASDKGSTIVEQARAAIGGESRINLVESLGLKGTFRALGMADAPEGKIEMSFALPGQLYTVKSIGTPPEGADAEKIEVEKMDHRNVIVLRGPRAEGQAKIGANAGPGNELAYHMLGLLLTTPSTSPVTYAYGGEADTPVGRCDVLEVKGAGDFAARVFVDKTTHLPAMMTYRGFSPRGMIKVRLDEKGGSEARVIDPETMKDRKVVVKRIGPGEELALSDIEVRFADFRSVDGLTLPFSVTRSVNGQPDEAWTIESYAVNDPDAAKKFPRERVVVVEKE